jgi:hypothetical protein
LTIFDVASEEDVLLTTFTKKGVSLGRSLINIPEMVGGQIFILKVGIKDLSN